MSTALKLVEPPAPPVKQDNEPPEGYRFAAACAALTDPKNGEISQQTLAEELGCSPAKISQYCKQQYKVSLESLREFDAQIGAYLARRAQQRRVVKREDLYFTTTHARRLEGYLNYCLNNHKMRIIRAGTGMGKSHTFRNFKKQHKENVFIMVCRDSRRSGRMFVGDLYREIKGETMPDTMKYYVAEDQIFQALERRDALIIFDDAHKLSTRTLSWISELFDASRNLGIVLGDQSDAQDSPGFKRAIDFERNPQILRRIGGEAWTVEFPIVSEDVELFTSYFGITARDVVSWLANSVNLPETRYDWLSEIVTETARFFPASLNDVKVFETVHQKLRKGR